MDQEHDPLRRSLDRLDEENRRLKLLGLHALTPDLDGPMLEVSDGDGRPGKDRVHFLRDGLGSG